MNYLIHEIPQITQDYETTKGLLYDCVIETWAQKILEFGTDVGDSTRIFSTALRETGGHLWTVDILPPKWNEEIMRPYKNITVITQDSRNFKFKEGLVDLLYIDDHHADEGNIYPHIMIELDIFGELVRKGGRILVDDVFHSLYGAGIRQAIGEWTRQKGLSWKLDRRQHGLGIIQL